MTLFDLMLKIGCSFTCIICLVPYVVLGQVQFTDQTALAGINFYHTFGSPDKKYILESHGSGAAFFDYDNDGMLDLYVVNGSTFANYKEKRGPGNILYRNRKDGTFVDHTTKAGVGDAGWGAGCAVGDLDNDGYRDLYITNYGANLLYHNKKDGTFSEKAAEAGIASRDYSASAAFLDYDNDGDLDLYVTNYVVFDIADMPDDAYQKERCIFFGGIQVYCGPKGMVGAPDLFYRNDGNLTFTDVTKVSGIGAANSYYGLGVIPIDYDDDGDLDLYVANDETPNVLFDNKGDGTFIDKALLTGIAYNGDGEEEAGMGVDSGDYDNDGDQDLYVTNFFRETNTFYRNEGNRRFADVTTLIGLAFPTLNLLGWGTKFFDSDNDGDLDLFVANGHVYPQVDQVQSGSPYRQSNQLFENRGNGAFIDISAAAGPAFNIEKVSRGACSGDYDNDGDIDIFVVNLNDNPTLLRNDSEQQNNWCVIQVFGTQANRDGIGTKISLTIGDRVQWRTINSAGSYLSAHDIRAHFGLGQHEQADQITIYWPDGTEQSLVDIPANQLLILRQGQAYKLQDLTANPYGL